MLKKVTHAALIFLVVTSALGCAKTSGFKKTISQTPTASTSMPPMSAYNAPKPASPPAPVAPLVKGEKFTARQGLSLAEAEARKIQSDANIRKCSAPQVDGDGRAEEWTFVFWSPAAQQDVFVTIRLGEVSATRSEATTGDLWMSMAPMVKWNIDSAKAIEAALDAGLKRELEKQSLSPADFEMKVEVVHGKIAWEVSSKRGKTIPYYIDAETGEFIDFNKP